MNFAEQTKYPKLFRKTYWGSLSGKCDPEIIINRNEMVEKFGIYKSIENRSNNAIRRTILDHAEFYMARDLLAPHPIMFVSLYENIDLSQFGFEKSKPIYAIGADSWYRLFSGQTEYKQCMRRVTMFAKIQWRKNYGN